jgi:hypothetical protein
VTPGRRTAAAVGAALVLRLALWAHLSRDPNALLRADSPSYVIPAVNLVEGHGFSGSLAPPFSPETFRTPGYPVFLGLFRLAAPGERWASFTQAVLDAGTALLAALCAAELGAGAWAWLAALLYGLEPVALAHSPLILTEPLFGFLVMLGLYFLLRAGEEGRPARAAAAGFLLSLATLVRPISLYLWIPLCAALVWPWRRGQRALAALALGACLLPAAWCARNQRLFGSFSFSSLPGDNLLYYDAVAARAAQGVPVSQAQKEVPAEFQRLHPSFDDPFERSKAEAAFAKTILLSHPLAAARVHLVSGVKMLLGPGAELLAQELWGDGTETLEERAGALTGRGTRAVLAHRPALIPVVLWDALLLLAGYLLALRGALRAWRRGAFFAAAWLTPLAYLLVISTGGWCYYRFRVPLWPLFCALAALGAAPTGKSRAPSGARRSS